MKRTVDIKKGSLSVGSGLTLSSMTKAIMFGKNTYTARHVVVPASEVETTTVAHHLNLRDQESLTLDAVRDIYSEVLEEGVKQEGVAYFNKETGLYELFDASRRRFCAIHAETDLPLWVLDELPSAKDILAYVQLTQKVKLFSWREVGTKYLKFAKENAIDASDLERLAEEFGVSTETIRKKVNAALLNQQLIESFPDCQGIPTTYYMKLGRVERNLSKLGRSVGEFVTQEIAAFETNSSDVELIQADLLAHYETKINELLAVKPKSTPVTQDLAQFSEKNTYARLKVSADGRKTTLEFARMPKEVISDIEEYVRIRLASNS
ncbi:ParB family protein [Vibrio sonorensis]|uniref:ParB family protein n=1 Tax=Vibrio sonorensis TaxID=1004316 RepID=UPI0008DAABD2|nr:ParB family protein [Vibrio sonorensis]